MTNFIDTIAHGWRYQPGLRRCDRGWNDTSGKSHGCKDPGAREVGNAWLCDDHADEIPDPTETVYRSCSDCCAASDLPPRSGAPGQWYWCPTCMEVWQEDGPVYDSTRPTVGEFIFIGLWMTYILALLLTLIMLASWWINPDFVGASDEDQVQAMLGGAALAFIPWLIGIWISNVILNELLYWGSTAWEYLWGAPSDGQR